MRPRRVAAAAGVLLVSILGPAAGAHADPVPYQDPAATGTITLCDTQGHVATHGDIHTKPFVWRAVGSGPPPPEYAVPGRTAALYGYQPIKDVDPQLWNGDYLTGSSQYTSTDHPMAAATAADPSLADLLDNYPPKWDGLIELRMFLSAPASPALTNPYNAATIRVTGDTWTVVAGGTAGCDSGRSKSAELILPSIAALPKPKPNATTDVPAAPGHHSGGHRSSTAASGSGRPSDTAGISTGASSSAAAAPGADAASPAHRPAAEAGAGASVTTWALTALGVALLVGGYVLWRRSRPGRQP